MAPALNVADVSAAEAACLPEARGVAVPVSEEVLEEVLEAAALGCEEIRVKVPEEGVEAAAAEAEVLAAATAAAACQSEPGLLCTGRPAAEQPPLRPSRPPPRSRGMRCRQRAHGTPDLDPWPGLPRARPHEAPAPSRPRPLPEAVQRRLLHSRLEEERAGLLAQWWSLPERRREPLMVQFCEVVHRCAAASTLSEELLAALRDLVAEAGARRGGCTQRACR